jgi:hypothetical protein
MILSFLIFDLLSSRMFFTGDDICLGAFSVETNETIKKYWESYAF